ncbi:MAG TPA: ABC transporter ATP-binding protein [Paludibacteraceae bacterium]|nr:ABC transporter ATP-binding protein [Paludibacteraceae bacterium]HQB68828.1 ABC transporter ATP-binding protein [Paludibacteraceae bacterium]HRS67491.1 ABC transporter ATP-binding protein [Paludibacteraceae bacterium]
MPFLEVKNVSKQYANHLALDNVSLSIEKQHVYGLLGPNGAGKTTLIRIINTITAPDNGEVLLNGKPLTPNDTARIGYLPEERGLYKKMKVGEQALYLSRLKGLSKSDALKRLKYWFEKFEIETWWDKKVEELSKGMAQKVQFITTVLHEPELLIFDEPFSGFDPVNADLLKREILELRDKGATIIFSTHNMESVEAICDDIALINHARVVLQGSVSEIQQQFKENVYSAIIRTQELKPNTLFKVIDKKTIGNHTQLRLKTVLESNALLQALISDYEVKAFNEELPSMHEIFIKTVTENH